VRPPTEEEEEERKAAQAAKAAMRKMKRASSYFKGGDSSGTLRVVPLYAQLPAKEQMEAFADPRPGERIVIVATNVAETSVTLPNVRYVVDCGREKKRHYVQRSGVSSFEVQWVSKASANQRAGRAGRVGPGHCYRLFSSAVFNDIFQEFPPVNLLLAPLDSVLLFMASLGISNLRRFPWPTPPEEAAVSAARQRLVHLGALIDDPKAALKPGAGGECTKLGMRLAMFPIAPRYARMIYSAVMQTKKQKGRGLGHCLAAIACLSLGNVFDYSPPEDEDGVDVTKLIGKGQERPYWSCFPSDVDALVWAFGGYAWAKDKVQFCRQHKIFYKQMFESYQLANQLARVLQQKMDLQGSGVLLEVPLKPMPPTKQESFIIHDVILTGLLDHVSARLSGSKCTYRCADVGPDENVFLHPGSNCFQQSPKPSLVAYNQIIATHRTYMRECLSVDPNVLGKLKIPSLVEQGDLLTVPNPRYLPEGDRVVGFITPVYKPLDYPLPTIEVDVGADAMMRYRVFARALLEGTVIPALKQFTPTLLVNPSMVTSSWTNAKVFRFVTPLYEARVGSRAELLEKWEKDPVFLAGEYSRWLPKSQHAALKQLWPPKMPTSR